MSELGAEREDDGRAPGGSGLVAVTGPHRSGTSALTRALVLLGLSAGDPDRLMPPDEDNPGGYWENLRVAQLHDELLAALGGWWSAPPVLAPGWELDESLSPFWTWAAQLVQDHFEPFGRCVVKDPRLCFTLPLWRVLTPVDPVVVGVRHPAAVASSLQRRDGFDPELGAWLWLRHVAAVAAVDPDALVVDYDDWFTAPQTVVDRLVTHVGLDAPDDTTRAAVTDWIRDDLRRSSPSVGDGRLLGAAVEVHRAVCREGLAVAGALGALPTGWERTPPG